MIVPRFELPGALAAMIFAPCFALAATFLFVRQRPWFSWRLLIPRLSSNLARKLFGFAIMTSVSGLLTPLTQLTVRNVIASELSIVDAGLWQGMWRLSEVYLSLFTTAMSAYFIPRFAELLSASETKRELVTGLRSVAPAVAAVALTIFLLRDYVILGLFSPDFYRMRDLFLFQLLGDVLKITSWVFGFLVVAKRRWKIFIACEIAFSLVFICGVINFVQLFGLVGAAYAHALTYFGYLVVMIVIAPHLLREQE